MKVLWLAVVGCVCVLTHGHPQPVSTTDTLVIAKSDDTSTEPEVSTTEQSEVTTEGPLPPIKLTEMEVTSSVSLRYAHTLVVAHVKNPAKRAQEANFRVLLPETAFISGFVMTLDGKSYKAFVKEKEEAKQIYDKAVSHGLGAAHVEAKARDSNQFVVSVNVEASSSAVFNLTYEELLVRRNGVYNHAVNLHPGALVPKLSVTVHIKEAQKITDLRVPQIRTGNEIDATKDDAQNTKAVVERGNDDKEATIRFSPDVDEQLRLMEIYADKAKESTAKSYRPWYAAPEEPDNKAQGVLGQFVVQYDVERPKDGEILVNDGHFVHFFAPSDLAPLPKFVVFVLDTSGSMSGRKIEQLREAMQTILSDLNPDDYFNIVDFASTVTVHDLNEDQVSNVKRVPPSPATPENIAKAKNIVSRLQASTSTNIAGALDTAVDIIHKRTSWGKQKPSDNHTDGVTTAITVSTVYEGFVYERMQELEPIIIFLTDGEANVGVSNPTDIVNQVTEKITQAEEKVTIFSLAFGNSADRDFLRKLSLRNNGFFRHIYEAADAALQLQDFYRRVSSPLLADVKFTYPETQVQESSVTKNKFGIYFAGSELVVAGKVADNATEVSAQINSFCNTLTKTGSPSRTRYMNTPQATVPTTKQEFLPLERIWAYLTIKQLLDKNDATDSKDDPKKKALNLALKYEFVTPLTSLVVVKPNATHAVDAEPVDNNPHHNLFPIGVAAKTSHPHHALGLSGSYSPNMRYIIAPTPSLSFIGQSYPSPSYHSFWTDPHSSLPGWSTNYPTRTTTLRTPSSTAPSVQSSLQLYHLQEYSWAESLVNTTADALVFTHNNTVYVYKLAKDSKVPSEAESPSESTCARAVGGDVGSCVYLTRCEPAKHITVSDYNDLHCSYHGFAGVCCSQKDVIPDTPRSS